jgi:acyl carrier protein
MGLDSVELLVSFEEYFNIQVPDLEAEKIRTVQEMVDSVATHLEISNNSIELKLELFEKLKSLLIQIGVADQTLTLSDTIFNLLDPNDKESWVKISEGLGLNVPQPFIKSDSIINKLFRSVTWTPKYDWKTVTVDQFVTAIYADNYAKIIDNKAIKNKYEILIAVIAITVDKLGVDLYEVQPDKNFVKDFGID